MRTDPWHSILPNEPFVYHFETECTLGDNIQPEYRTAGTSARRPCELCTKLGNGRIGTAARNYDTGGDPLADIAPRRLGTAERFYDTGGDPLGRIGEDPLADLALRPWPRLGE